MARSRTIKPGFFSNEQLAECSAFARLLFAGLWTLCDKHGRLEDRPKRIRGELFPHDDVDADKLLSELDAAGLIDRYDGEGCKVVQVINFGKHQRVHPKEPDYGLSARKSSGRAGKGSGKLRTSTEQAGKVPGKLGSNAPSSFFPLPSSSFPLPSSELGDGAASPETIPAQPEPEATQPPEPPKPKAIPDGPSAGQTWPSFLATEWAFHFSGTAKTERDVNQLTKFFSDLIDSGHDPTAIRDRIRARDRPKRQATWDFSKQFFPSPGDSIRGNSRNTQRRRDRYDPAPASR